MACARLPAAHEGCSGDGAPQGCAQAGEEGTWQGHHPCRHPVLWLALVAGRRELVDKDFLGGSNPCKKAVSPVGLGMLCACRQHSLAFYHAGEELLLDENIIMLFLLLIPPQGCWVQRSWL